jgi:putative chitobiose transport system permease protein
MRTRHDLGWWVGSAAAVSIAFLIAFVAVFPFLWLLSTSLKPAGEVFAVPPQLLPTHPTLDAYASVWNEGGVNVYLFNSMIVAALAVVLNVSITALAAYPLAFIPFRGRRLVFLAILATMMIPFQTIMLPVFIITRTVGLANNFLGVVLPTAVTAIGVYFMREGFRSIPRELRDAAKVDGCTEFQTWRRVALPLVRTPLAAVAILTFTASWSEFLWPLIILSDPDKFTLPVGIQYFMSILKSNWNEISAAAIIATIPTMVLFLLLQRFFYAGVTVGAVKG